MMPVELNVRRERNFRPINYTSRHKLVAALHALGKTRSEVAMLTGYSPSHVSRITGMSEAINEAGKIEDLFVQALVKSTLANLRCVRDGE